MISINRNGAFKAGWPSERVREYARVLDVMPKRRDRIPLSQYDGICILGRVETAVKDRKQRDLPETAHYSVIR